MDEQGKGTGQNDLCFLMGVCLRGECLHQLNHIPVGVLYEVETKGWIGGHRGRTGDSGRLQGGQELAHVFWRKSQGETGGWNFRQGLGAFNELQFRAGVCA